MKSNFALLALSLLASQLGQAAPGAVWHEPANPHPDLAGPTMRDPLYEAADNDLVIYQGFFKDGGANGDQNGGSLKYRFVPNGGVAGPWNSVVLSFHSNVGGNQFWKATLPSTSAAATDVIEYYVEVTFTGAAPETTYLYGGDLINNFSTTTSEATAQASPYSIRNRPGWIFHADNRTIAGDDIQLRLKTGYIGPANDPATLWTTNGAVYYTTDGSDPDGSLGVPSGTSAASPLSFDGTDRDNSGNGNAAFWRGTMTDVLSGLSLGDQVKYRVSLWNTATNEEKFADHSAGGETIFTYQNGVLGDPTLTVNSLNANYTTTKVFVDEIAGDSIPLNIIFQPGENNITDAEIYTNLNRRDRANDDANNDGYDDGISGLDGNSLVAGDDTHYYKAYTMTDAGGGTYTLTLPANMTGAYRLTARWKVSGDPNWRWYTNQSANRRDHAITVSPKDARDIVLYEINVLNIEATDDSFTNRSTIEDMHNAPGAWHNGNNRWDLDYLKALGANWLWFQPIHPAARDGREPFGGWDNTGNPPYEPGSPYAVRNFFEVSPIMTRNFAGDPFDNADLFSQANRDAAMTAWQNFVADADTKDVGIMLDAPFNHTGFDVELGQPGVDLLQPDGASWSASDEIRNREARFFSQDGDYADRASSSANIAAGPDRFDFGKWRDVKDVYFGRYDSLVESDSEPERSSYTNEGDWFDDSALSWTNNDFVQGGVSKNVTRQVWKYFATYATHWLDKTRPAGENRNSSTEAGLTTEQRYDWDGRGIDGLRCDFGQGLPPRAWEYIINVAREHKWNFVMMSESLDGGAVTYRSNRHFDILNENIVFPLKSASNKSDYRNIFENRRNAYGQGLVLINNVSHDEENYSDPWEALIRFSVASTLDGVPMIFPGQELGISTTSGYNHYELNFGKQIPHFKRFNSMQPIWNDTDVGNDQLFPVYAGMGAARGFSPALRSSNRWFLDGDGGNDQIHAIAKYETANASPASSDVVLAFSNLDRNNTQADNFKIPSTLAGLLGLQDGRTYNAKNIAAYIAQDGTRRDQLLWGSGITGADLKSGGFTVFMNSIPTTPDNLGTPENEALQAWAAAPFEAQYLKVFDVTAPTATPAQPQMPNNFAYEVGTDVTFSWAQVPADSEGIVPHYEVTVIINSGNPQTFITTETSYTAVTTEGNTVSVSVRAVNPDDPNQKGPTSTQSQFVKLISSIGDEDGDGASNADEKAAGTDPMDASSKLVVSSQTMASNGNFTITWAPVAGRTYKVQARADLATGDWVDVATGQTSGTYTDVNPSETQKFYRVVVE
ncbi:MAG: hypothetical protein ACPGKS_02600 [Coraliomargarita sp.]